MEFFRVLVQISSNSDDERGTIHARIEQALASRPELLEGTTHHRFELGDRHQLNLLLFASTDHYLGQIAEGIRDYIIDIGARVMFLSRVRRVDDDPDAAPATPAVPAATAETVGPGGVPPPVPPPPPDAGTPLPSLADGVLWLLADRGKPATAEEVAALLECNLEAAQAVLAGLVEEGLATSDAQTVFELTEQGKTAASQATNRGGRKPVVEYMLGREDYCCTVFDLVEALRVHRSQIQQTFDALQQEGMVVPYGHEDKPAGRKGAPRRRFRLTDLAISLGHHYQPPTGQVTGAWTRPADTREAVIEILVRYRGQYLTAIDISQRLTHRNDRTTRQVLDDGLAAGYLERENIGTEGKPHYRYRLTESGLIAARAYLKLCEEARQRASVHRAPRGAPIAARKGQVVVQVVLDGDPDEVARLIERIKELCESPHAAVEVLSS